MTAVLLLLTLSALIGFGLGTSFRWPAIVASSAVIAVISSVILQIQGFGTLPGIAIVVACKQDQAVRWSRNRDNRWTSRSEFPDFCRDCGNGNREVARIAVVTRRALLLRMVVFRSDSASVPSCSRPSRTSPSGGRETRGHP